MAVDLSLLSSNSTTNIDTNFERVEAALQDAVSRSGIVPNSMSADLDLDSNDLLNVARADIASLYIDGEPVVPSDLGSFAANSVGTNQIVDGAVTTPKIADDAITIAKMADDSVDTDQIVDAAVTSDKITNDATELTAIKNKLGLVKVYDTVAAMVAATGLSVGQLVTTRGYYAKGDGGGNDYSIVAAATGTADGGSYINLSGSLGQAKGVFPNNRPNLLQWGVKADKVTNDTVAMQAALDWTANNSATLYGIGLPRTTRQANVTQVTFWGTGACFDLNGMVIKGVATTTTNSVLQFKQGLGFTQNIVVGSDFNDNYECAIHRYTNNLNTYYPGREKFRNITISGFRNGLVVGGRPNQSLVTYAQGTVQADGVATDAPLSEEFWDGLDVQDCPRPLYFNQPNGKVIFTNCILECKPDGYEAENGAVSAKTAVSIAQGEVNVIGGAVESNQDDDALLVEVGNLGHINIVGATMESKNAPIYLAGGGRLRMSNMQNLGYNGADAMFYVDDEWYGEVVVSDCFLLRGAGFASTVPVAKGVASPDGSFGPNLNGFFTFSNVEFGDINFAYGATYNPILLGVRGKFDNCVLATGTLSGSTYTRTYATRFHTGANLLVGKVDVSNSGITAYGTNGSATSAGWTVAVSGAGTKDWGKVTTSLPTVPGETPPAAFRIETGVGGLVSLTSPAMPVHPTKTHFLVGLIKSNGAAANLLVRNVMKNWAGSTIANHDAFNGNVNLIANTSWQPFMLRLNRNGTPLDAATLNLFIQAQEGAGIQFANLEVV